MGCEGRGEVQVTLSGGRHDHSQWTRSISDHIHVFDWEQKPLLEAHSTFPLQSYLLSLVRSCHVVGTSEARKPTPVPFQALCWGVAFDSTTRARGVRARGRWLGFLWGFCWAGRPFSFLSDL